MFSHSQDDPRKSARFRTVLCILAGLAFGCSDDTFSRCPPNYEGFPSCANCGRPECCVPLPTDPGCIYPDNIQDNTNKDAIVIGGSQAMGCYCFLPGSTNSRPLCGFIPCLEELTGMDIANFAEKGQRLSNSVHGLRRFARVDSSVKENPAASRVFILMGGNDVLMDLVKSALTLPRPSNGCRLSLQLTKHLRETVDDLQLLIRRYRYFHGIPEVVVSSQPPVEERSSAPSSCQAWTSAVCPDCYLCINEVLEQWSQMVKDLADSMGGAENGIYFADIFHAFPQDPGECSLFCDCVHSNCTGMQIIAETFHEALY